MDAGFKANRRSRTHPDRESSQPLERRAKPRETGARLWSDVVREGASSRPVRSESPVGRRKTPGALDWQARGMARAKAFVAALRSGDEEQMRAAFYDPDYGKDPRLYEIIREKRYSGWWISDERGHLVEWFREALEGCTIEELEAISENLYRDFGGNLGIFREVQRALGFCINELFHADAMVRAVLRNQGIESAARKFAAHFDFIGLVGVPRQSRMSMLMNGALAKLDPEQMESLRDHLKKAPKLLAVTALRLLVDPN